MSCRSMDGRQHIHTRILTPLGVLCGIFLPTTSALALVPSVAIPGAWDVSICSATGLCSNSPATGFLSLLDFLIGIVIPTIRIVFVGLAVLYVSYYALTLLISGYDETTITEQRKAFSFAGMGMGIVGVASFFVNTFAPSAAGVGLINPGPFIFAVERVIDFITIVTGAFLVFVISMAGARIIALQGNESEVDKQKKNFFNGLLGVVILLTARVVVEAVLPATGGADLLVVEVAGVARFLLEIIAGLAILALMVSGFLMMVSLNNDNLRQRARRILFSTLIILIIVVFSHTLISVFIPAGTPITPTL
jgi:hypothetical protein